MFIRLAVLFLSVVVMVLAARAEQPARLPDGVVMKGSRNISKVWLTLPTRRYGHAILGDAIEAGGLALVTSAGKFAELRLDASHVFEDRRVRLADLDGDGRDEMITVLSSLSNGASLAVYGLRGGVIRPVAKTPFIGRAYRWLNPAGIADFDGDGLPEIAIVVTPHIGGQLQLWKLRGGKLQKLAQAGPVSNHIIGERAQNRSSVVTLKDGTKGLVVETVGHDGLILYAYRGGMLRKIAEHDARAHLEPGLKLERKGRRIVYRTGPGKPRDWDLP